jgi:hypothetical protein
VSQDRVPRRDFRVSTRHRGGYEGALTDVQLQVADTGSIVWARTFSDQQQADEFLSELEADLDALDDATFRRKYGVPSSA